jgi:AraC-like DNA-binding protein
LSFRLFSLQIYDLMAFKSLIEKSLECRLSAYYRTDRSDFDACLSGLPAYTNCLICGMDKASGTLEATYFVPQGEKFDKERLEGLFVNQLNFELVFFDAWFDGVPVFGVQGVSSFKVTSMDQLVSFVSLVGYEQRNSLLFKEFIVGATLEKLSVYLLRDLILHSKNVFDKVNDHFNNDRLIKILTFIHQNIHTDLSFDHIANQILLSPDYVSQFFKKSVGSSIQNYLIDQRVKLGLYNLISSSVPIASVATKSGFIDQAYFNRRFKLVYGLNPISVRKKYKLISISQAGALMSSGSPRQKMAFEI